MELVLVPPKSPVAFFIANVPVRYYGLFFAASILTGILLIYFVVKKKFSKTEADYFLDFSPYLVLVSIIGARLFYVLSDLNFYLKKPIEIILVNHGGLSIFGGLFFGILFFYFHAKRNNINFWKYADVFSLALPLCQSIGRWGNFFNQEAYGKPVSDFFLKLYINTAHRKPDYFDIEYYHPAFLYESILNFSVFIILFYLFFKTKHKNGSIFLLYLMSYSVIRFIVESIRIDSVLNIYSMPVAKIFCIVTFFSAFYFYLKILKAEK